jgi:hypothetical protein
MSMNFVKKKYAAICGKHTKNYSKNQFSYHQICLLSHVVENAIFH